MIFLYYSKFIKEFDYDIHFDKKIDSVFGMFVFMRPGI